MQFIIGFMKNWYMIQSKPRQELIAEENLENQGYTVFHPKATIDNKVVTLFPRYLFIQLDDKSQSWTAIHFTRGVANFVRFGLQFAKVPDDVIECIKERHNQTVDKVIELNSFKSGDKVHITEGTFKGCEAIFNSYDSDERLCLLMNLIGKEHKLILPKKSVVAV